MCVRVYVCMCVCVCVSLSVRVLECMRFFQLVCAFFKVMHVRVCFLISCSVHVCVVWGARVCACVIF